MNRICRYFAPFIFVLIFCFGCGNGQVPCSGTIKYSSGEVVPHGTVFFSTPQSTYSGEVKDGAFTLGGLKAGDGLPPGTYKVSYLGADESGASLVDDMYSNSETSGIVFEVKKGEKNQFEITVESK